MTKKQEPGHPRKIDATFKHEVVRLVLDKDMSVREVAIAMGVGDTAVRRWVQQYKSANGLPRPSGPLTAEQLRIRELEIENRQLREDNDILKKASAFFARTLR